MRKVLSLSVHKNNKAQRERKMVREMMRQSAHNMAKDPDIAGYAFVSWNSEMAFNCAWHCADASPIRGNMLPTFVSHAIIRRMCLSDAEDILLTPLP